MKDFLLIANKNCITYKEFFPYIKDRIVQIGYTHPGDFDQPDEDIPKSLQGLTRWFTTLSTSSKPPLVLTKTYDPEKYPKYDNYDAINVDKVKDIPWDYDGVMGVPITILDHNLDNVEVQGIWNDKREEADFIVKGTPTYLDEKHKSFQGPVIDGKAKYSRVLIKKNFEIVDCKEPALSMSDIAALGMAEYPSRQIMHNGKKCQKTYHRFMIKKTLR
jgi:hypothetical protein